jgi:hypothetical protein
MRLSSLPRSISWRARTESAYTAVGPAARRLACRSAPAANRCDTESSSAGVRYDDATVSLPPRAARGRGGRSRRRPGASLTPARATIRRLEGSGQAKSVVGAYSCTCRPYSVRCSVGCRLMHAVCFRSGSRIFESKKQHVILYHNTSCSKQYMYIILYGQQPAGYWLPPARCGSKVTITLSTPPISPNVEAAELAGPRRWPEW